MARDFIKIDRQSAMATQSGLLLQYINTLRQALELGTKVLAIMGHNEDGTVFTDLEALFGIPAGKGQVVYDLVNGSVGSMNGQFQVSDAKNLPETVG